ncbi:MAG TPA: hypothetical protein PLL10_04460 [Elusimicrobiales bacterium]|nr:hypothetical protein [Elusimicrobiales bacterium]
MPELLHKHYLELDTDGTVIRGYTDAFEQPKDGAVLLLSSPERHFQLPLQDADGHIYRWNGTELVEKTFAERHPLTAEKAKKIAQAKAAARELLYKSDWKLIRHQEEVLRAVSPTLSQAELAELMEERQAIRDHSSALELEIEALDDVSAVMNFTISFQGE